MPKRIYLALVALTVIAAPVLAKNLPPATVHVALQIRPGLWEYADRPKVTGDTIFPDAMLAHVPPAQRAQFLAETRKQMVEPQKARECMTQPKFEQRVSLSFTGCARKVLSNTASALEILTVCRSETQGMRQETQQRIVMSSPVVATSSTRAVSTRGGKAMTLESTEIGRWISADCGNLKNGVIQQMP
ncbi:MAG TPA: DUF3617 family protein [Rhizomicrobium sp.]